MYLQVSHGFINLFYSLAYNIRVLYIETFYRIGFDTILFLLLIKKGKDRLFINRLYTLIIQMYISYYRPKIRCLPFYLWYFDFLRYYRLENESIIWFNENNLIR